MALVKPCLDAGAFVAAGVGCEATARQGADDGTRGGRGGANGEAKGVGRGKGGGKGGGRRKEGGGGEPRETVKSKDGVAHDFTCEVSAGDG